MEEIEAYKTMKTKILSIIGPTACGKTKLALSLAEKLNVEIISADSMQVYKEFNILSAKPTKAELEKVPHHLIDIISVEENYSVAEFTSCAHKCISEIVGRGKVPLIVGGTGLYMDSLVKNINYSPCKRTTCEEKFDYMNNEQLMKKLIQIDTISAEKIHLNDRKRLLRAVEFFYSMGYPISKQVELSRKSGTIYDVFKIGLNFSNRQKLYDKINSRIDKMLEMGLLEEVKYVYENFSVSQTAQAAIGYKEILDFITSKSSLEDAIEILKRNTRRYAKRQLTWFRRDPEVNWIYVDDYQNFSEVVSCAEQLIKNM